MTIFLLNILLAIVWIALTGSFTPSNLVIGFVLSYLLLWMTQRLIAPTGYFTKVPRVIAFAFFFMREIIKANLRVAKIVLSPRLSVHPAVVAIPLDATSNAEITLLANLITLTPGTLFLDVSEDRCIIYVHAMEVDDLDAFRANIKNGFERRVMEIMR
jgi:multicomponent Na+:H+ antiporter subunit E